MSPPSHPNLALLPQPCLSVSIRLSFRSFRAKEDGLRSKFIRDSYAKLRLIALNYGFQKKCAKTVIALSYPDTFHLSGNHPNCLPQHLHPDNGRTHRLASPASWIVHGPPASRHQMKIGAKICALSHQFAPIRTLSRLKFFYSFALGARPI
jgi:hypothetical protein